MSSNPTPLPERGLSRRALELAFGLFILALAGLMVYDSYTRGMGWASDGPMSGYFPFRIGLILLLASLSILWHARRASVDIAVSGTQLTGIAKILIPLTIYIALIQPLGIYLPSALLIGALMVMLDRFRWWQIVLGALLTPIILFYVFEMQFHVPLPKGPVEAWFGR